jgi:hypothetical protein
MYLFFLLILGYTKIFYIYIYIETDIGEKGKDILLVEKGKVYF